MTLKILKFTVLSANIVQKINLIIVKILEYENDLEWIINYRYIPIKIWMGNDIITFIKKEARCQ